MGFYIRKSINFGGVRFNFSKSGIGASVGVKGFRVGTNSRGNYIHMGRGGLYYRAAIGKKQNDRRVSVPQLPSPSPAQQSVGPQIPQEELHFKDIDSGDITYIVDSSSQDVVDEINAKRKKFPFWPLGLLLVFIPKAGFLLAIISAILLAVLVDKRRKTTVLVYDIDEDTEQEIQGFYNAFDELIGCSSAWHVVSQASVQNKKYHAGANQLVNRATIRVSYNAPKHLKTNVKVPALPVGNQTIYFFPDRILIYDKKAVGGLAYESFSVTRRNQRFIENGAVPRDGTIVDHTWQYVNKSGGPDRRFSNNRQLPILLYSEVFFTSNRGLNELVQFSKQTAGIDLIGKLEQYKRSAALSRDGVPFQPSDRAKQTVVANALPVTPSEHFAPIRPAQVSQGRAYAPEKIIPHPQAKSKQADPYAIFKRMKQVGARQGGYVSYYSDDADTFFKQAMFMKDFTDNYGEIVPLDTYYATYGKMNDAQLRTYFTWRTKARQGSIESTSLSYVFCYIFELLNDVGVANPADALEKLIALWLAFREFDNKIDNYLRDWIRDYYVIHKAMLPIAFTEYSQRFPIQRHGEDIEILTKATPCTWDDLRVIEASSSFKITNGQFYKAGNQEVIEGCACFVIRELAKLFKRSGVDFRNMFIEKRNEKIYSLYQGAVHRDVTVQTVTVELSDFETMKHNSRGWHREYISITQYRTAIGYIMKLMEVKMRQHFGYKRSLQAPAISVLENCFLNSEPDKFEWPNRPTMDKLKTWKGKAFAVINSAGFESAIAQAISDYCKAAHIVITNGEVRIVKPVEIDMSKLQDIEREHIATAEKLITEEPDEIAVDVPVAVPVAEIVVPEVSEVSGIVGLVDSLSAESRNLLQAILQGENIPLNSELLVETINEKAFPAIEDNLIDYSEGTPYIYDDYVDELQAALGGNEWA